MAFVTDADSELALREGMAELVPSIQIKRSSIRQATALLRKMPSPEVLVVDITGEDAPLAALHDLSEVVEPSTRVLVVGDRSRKRWWPACSGRPVCSARLAAALCRVAGSWPSAVPAAAWERRPLPQTFHGI